MTARIERSSTTTRFRRIGVTSSGCTVWTSSRRTILPIRRWRTTFIDPDVDPAEAPMNISPTIVTAASGVHSVEIGVHEPGGGHDRDGLADCEANGLLTAGDPFGPELCEQDDRGQGQEGSCTGGNRRPAERAPGGGARSFDT